MISTDYESLKHSLLRSRRARSRYTRFMFKIDDDFFSFRLETPDLVQKTLFYINEMRERTGLDEEGLIAAQAKTIVELHAEAGRIVGLAIPAYALATMNEDLKELPPFVAAISVRGIKGVTVLSSDTAAEFFEEFEKAQKVETGDVKPGYEPCPRCKANWGMGLVTRKNTLAVQCTVCEYRGPEVRCPTLEEWATWPVPSEERDRQAIARWNGVNRRG